MDSYVLAPYACERAGAIFRQHPSVPKVCAHAASALVPVPVA